MTDISFVAAGWIGTAVSIAAYAISVRRRIRRARGSSLPRTGTQR